jgi:ribonucleotide reductase alpha subunit
MDAAIKIWKKVSDDVKKFGLRNNAVTCIRPTGTIGLLMDSTGTMSAEP